MAKIVPFCGLRYNEKVLDNINAVFAPPYDVISEAEQKRLYAQHPYNVVRLILGKTFKDDNSQNNRYTRAECLLNEWTRKGIFVFDKLPSIYIYTQDYVINGINKTMFGFIAGMQFEKGCGCLPHEHTLSKPKQDRMELLKRVQANLSPIYSFYLDQNNSVEDVLKPFMQESPLLDFLDADNVRHKFWQISDQQVIDQVRDLMLPMQLFIADGHHRYEVMRTYYEQMCEQNKDIRNKCNYVMMYFTSFNKNKLTVLPTHRLLKDVADICAKLKELEKYFYCRDVNNLEELTNLQSQAKGFAVGMYYNGCLSLLQIKNNKLLDNLMRDCPVEWRELDVAMLNKIVFEHIFNLNEEQKEQKISYTRDINFAFSAVDRNDCMLAFFPNPTKLEQVKKIAQAHNKMPQKSTYFYPKPITGLVINKF
ncbi:MAG: hypothetical protein DRP78_04765 [Candidatus Omnitrophota bacterium]|nr:MAG: hypothetical protein DRP78_04765 [Candidatus Omnitrophota bacterium]